MTNAASATPRIRQARLVGPSPAVDRRVNAVRDDLADVALAATVVVPRYAAGVERCCIVPGAMLRAAPDAAARAVSEVLFGEVFVVFDFTGGWAWGQCAGDGYVGWLAGAALGMPEPASHRVVAPTATVFVAPNIKSAVATTLPLNALVAAEPVGDSFFAAAGGFVHRHHLAPVGTVAADPIALAHAFVGTPYVWGGRTRAGIDCSGLTQAVALACGIAAPRDSDQQAAAFAVVDPAERRRGDLAVFPGHVGILCDADTLIHATAHAMATVVEPLAAVAARIAPTGFRRPTGAR